jgi:GDP-mannose 4,6-dehydratase
VRALITGVTGFVGSHLAEYLLANTDWDIVGMCRWRSPLDNIQSLIPEINKGGRVRLVYADLRDGIAVREAVEQANPTHVFHLAAQSYPKTSFTSPIDTLDTNVQGTVRLLDALRKSDAEIHVCSSSEVYGRAKTIPITEDAPFHPASPYAVSKVGADLMARHYAEAYGMRIQVTRMFTHTGQRRGDVFAESSFAKQIAMIEADMIPPVVKVGNLKSLRTIADVRDAVLNTLLSMSTSKIGIEVDPDRLRPVDADLQVPDCTKFKARTGWEPVIPFEQTMKDLLTYWRYQVKRGSQLQR